MTYCDDIIGLAASLLDGIEFQNNGGSCFVSFHGSGKNRTKEDILNSEEFADELSKKGRSMANEMEHERKYTGID